MVLSQTRFYLLQDGCKFPLLHHPRRAQTRCQSLALLDHTYSTILYSIILYCTILYCTILYYTIPYHTILHYIVPYCTILYYIILYSTLLYYIILYSTAPYFTILYQAQSSEKPRSVLGAVPPVVVGDLGPLVWVGRPDMIWL